MKKIIAIVDDEKDLNELMRSYLLKEGYEVRSYFTFAQSDEHILDADVDLWLLDIMLDEKSGFDLFEKVKEAYPDKPVVFISARDKEFDRIIGLEKGSDDYITKPFNMKEVVLRINNLMKRVYKNDNRIEIDGYMIDTDQRRVLINDESITLTTKEYDLLMLFVSNVSIAFSRDDILYKIWGTDYYGSDRVVDDTIRRVRNKLPNLLLQTIHGYGYRLH